MNTPTRELPSLPNRLKMTEKLTDADFKAFDFTWEGRDLNKSKKLIELLDVLALCFQSHTHIEEMFAKIELTIQQLKDGGYLHVSDIDNIAKRIYVLQDAEGILADDEDKKRLEQILTRLLQLRAQMTQPTKVIPVQRTNVEVQPVEEDQIEDEDLTEGDTEQSEPYVDTSDINQKLENAMLIQVDDRSRFMQLLKLVHIESNGNAVEIAQTLLNALQTAESLPTDKPFIIFTRNALVALAPQLKWDEGILINRRIEERIKQMESENGVFKKMIYQELLKVFRRK
jgi:hypothetical protein